MSERSYYQKREVNNPEGSSVKSFSGESPVISHAPSASFSNWAFSKELKAIRTANSILRAGASVQTGTALHRSNVAQGSDRIIPSDNQALRNDRDHGGVVGRKRGDKAEAVQMPNEVGVPSGTKTAVWNTLSENALFHAEASQTSECESSAEL
jgi:hypothetical protein